MGLLPFEQAKREVVVLDSRAKSNPAYGCDPNSQSLDFRKKHGIVIINKPKNPTSHQVSGYVKDILELKLSGHSGTLDPIVTGVLPVALDKGTKLIQALINTGKEYVCYMRIHKPVEEQTIRDVCASFIGDIEQLPPVKSAIKRQLRTRTIYYLEILEIVGQDVLFKVGCQAGTYIRKLCTDIGEKLGGGANMQQLIRTKAASFNSKDTITLQELQDAAVFSKDGDDSHLFSVVHPIERAVDHIPKIWVYDEAIGSILHGAQLAVPGIVKFDNPIRREEMVAIMSLKGELVALANAEMTGLQLQKVKKGIATKTLRVTMAQDVYPRVKNE
ncbi:MAG: H/ACA ribonucleoprotein complex subunit 4 [Candidatus Woesearchaeota archaeon]|jgi:H/ACA ribonucleoprotein complex subunit 4